MGQTLPESTSVLGIPIAVSTPAEAVRDVIALARSHRCGHIHLVNAYTSVLADRSSDMLTVLESAIRNFPDGKPVARLASTRHYGARQVRGTDLFRHVIVEGQTYRLRHYLLGGTPDTLSALQQALRSVAPKSEIVGACSPPFRRLSVSEQVRQDDDIRRSNPDIVWIGLGTPKQDYEAARIAHVTGAVTVAVGAAFDFIAGTKREAPQWIKNLGLEWAYRLGTEPKRLWKRYLIGNAQFLWLVLRSTWRSACG